MMKFRNRGFCVNGAWVAGAVLLAVCVAKADDLGSSTRNITRLDSNLSVTPVMFSFCTPVEIPWWHSSWDVAGIRFCLPYGSCDDFSGLDVGVVTHADNSCGIQCSAVNIVDGDVPIALTVGGLVNVVEGSYSGLQIGGLVNVVNNDTSALQVGGLVNVVDGSFTGLQVGFVNVVQAQAKDAWQIGFWNQVEDLDHGVQIGVFNYASDTSLGFQLGVINIIANNDYPCVPIVNCRF